jgi:hypothetical protein
LCIIKISDTTQPPVLTGSGSGTTPARQRDVNVKALSSVRKLLAGDATIEHKNLISEEHVATQQKDVLFQRVP